MKKSRVIAVMAMCLLTFAVSAAVPTDGYRETLPLGAGLTYTRTVGTLDGSTPQREYILEYAPNETTHMAFVSGQYLHYTGSLPSMAAYAYPDERYVAGINADFFNMSTGVPESALIIGGELYTSDRDSYCLARRRDGSFFIDKPCIKLSLARENGETLDIMSLNKEFTVYGLYLYDNRYAIYTNVFESNTCVTLFPYDDVRTLDTLYPDHADAELDAMFAEYLAGSQDARAAFDAALYEKSGYMASNGRYYHLTDARPCMGQTENCLVLTVNGEAGSMAIPRGGYMLCASNSSYGYMLRALAVGEQVTITVGGNEAYYDVSDAVGCAPPIVKDGKATGDTIYSHYLTANPRSAAGIRADGTLVLYAVDGRQSSFSVGLTVKKMAERLIELGCVEACNFDGGGSTTFQAAKPGFDAARTVNSPSDRTERMVSDAVIFTSAEKKSGHAAAAYLYDDYFLTYSDAPLALPSPVFADENSYAALPSDVSVYTAEGFGHVADGIYYPDGNVGLIPVYATVDGNGYNTAAEIRVIDTPDEILLTADKKRMKVYETAKLTLSSRYEGMRVNDTADSYVWRIGGEDTVKTADGAAENDSGRWENGVFTPKKDGVGLEIAASRGNVSSSVRIAVDALPFADIAGNWGVSFIDELFDRGIVIGEPGEDGRSYFNPSRAYTRAEFAVMLSRVIDLVSLSQVHAITDTESDTDIGTDTDTDTEPDDDTLSQKNDMSEPMYILPFADEVQEWALDAAAYLYRAGLLDEVLHHDENGNILFDGRSPVTRKEVMAVLGALCPTAPEDYAVPYTDLNDAERADEAIRRVSYAGLFTGYENGELRKDNPLTRAEGATVFIRWLRKK